MTKERPILFSAPMVRAILEGRKTQTRRVVKRPKQCPENYTLAPAEIIDPGVTWWQSPTPRVGRSQECPYGKPCDRLWVRETFAHGRIDKLPHPCKYRADHPEADTVPGQFGRAWTPSIHMPRWASRIDLLITGVRVEKLQDISEADAVAEGIEQDPETSAFKCYIGDKQTHWFCPRESFRTLWQSINGHAAWNENPWLWVVEFERTKP